MEEPPVISSPRTSISSNNVTILHNEGSVRNVMVIFDASRELSTHVLEWTVQQVIQPQDTLTVLGILHQVLTPSTSNSPLRVLQQVTSQVTMGYKAKADLKSFNGKFLEDEAVKKRMYYSMKLKDIQKRCEMQDAKFEVKIKVGASLPANAVSEAKQLQASWVILDRSLKRHKKFISEQLPCNLIMMDRSTEGQILKLIGPVILGPALQLREVSSDSASPYACKRVPFETATSSGESAFEDGALNSDADIEISSAITSVASTTRPAIEGVLMGIAAEDMQEPEAMKEDNNMGIEEPELMVTKPEVKSKQSSLAPPLCSICKYKAPDFGKDFSNFMFSDIEKATNNFSSESFLSEGGYGAVYRGLLNGQHVAVKQHKLASMQGEKEFRAEVEVLSHAQHRNLITLLGICIEHGEKMLVYEYVCNKSLDWHLSAKNPDVLPWSARLAIAQGAARGLRYLHEDCRVGCIIHRDLRPHNILLTHDFTPMVGDFGLARWHNNQELSHETKVIGALGYLSPEYASSGQVSDKADVYSFGVVLLELITGRRAIDLSLPMGQTSLAEWARPRLDIRHVDILLDPRLADILEDANKVYEVQTMIHAASFCIRKEPSHRPKMSQILRILEGDKDDSPVSAVTALSPWEVPPRQSVKGSGKMPRVSSANSLIGKKSSPNSPLSYQQM